MSESAELSLIVFGIIMANIACFLSGRPSGPPSRVAEVIELARYRRR